MKSKQTKFKETEVGPIPEEWDVIKLENASEKIGIGPFGSSIKVETFVNDGIPVISGQHLNGFKLEDSKFNFITLDHAKKLRSANVFRGDVIFTHAGNIGQVAYIPNNSKYEKYIISQRQFYLRCNKERLLPEFITYFFKTPIGQHKLLSNRSQTGVPSIAQPVTHLRNIEIPLPTITEQKRIAEILETLDEKIELNRRMNENLEKIASVLFKHWFVDFEFPNEQGKPYKSSGGKMIDSELGLVPEEWEIKSISEVTKIVTKGTTPTTIGGNFADNGINFIKAESITENHAFDKNKFSFIDEETNDLLNRSKIEIDDLLYTIAGTIGRFLIVDESVLPANTNQAVAIIRINQEMATPYYLQCIFCLPEYKEELFAGVIEAVQANLSLTNIKKLKIILPNKIGLKLFRSQIEPIFKTIVDNQLQNENLAQIRDSLLPRLMSGKIRV